MSRLIAVTYGSLIIGAGQTGTDYHLTGKHAFTHTYGAAALTFEVVVTNPTRATFLSSEATLLSTFRTIDQALTVALDSTTRHTFNPASGTNTGLYVRPSIEQTRGSENTANSSRWRISIEVELPADRSGRSGRLSSTTDISEAPTGRRTVTVSGVYTALTSNDARDQFTAAAATFAATQLPSGTFELVGTPTAETDTQDKVCKFTFVYREILHGQTIGVVSDVAALVDAQLVINRVRQTSDSTEALGATQALEVLAASYSTSVDKDVSTDLAGLWEGTIRPYILATAQGISVSGAVIVMREEPRFNFTDNSITSTMLFLADPGKRFYSARESLTDNRDFGVILRPVWNGDPYARDQYKGMKSWTKTLKRVTVGIARNSAAKHPAPPKIEGFIRVRDRSALSEWEIGLPGERRKVQGLTTVNVYVKANVSKGGGTKGGGKSKRVLTGGDSGGSEAGDGPDVGSGAGGEGLTNRPQTGPSEG